MKLSLANRAIDVRPLAGDERVSINIRMDTIPVYSFKPSR